MAKEIERKFLVRGDDYKTGITPVFIRQGFVSTEKDKVVRVRVYGDRGFLALKGSGAGISRTEFEYEIPVEDAHELLKEFCKGPIIEKNRYVVDYESNTWEVDEFMRENSGLVIAEIELTHENEDFLKPPWLGDEVTSDSRYYNVNLLSNPFANW